MALATAPPASTLDDAAIQRLAATMRGPLVQPGDPTYDEVRKVYNGMIDRRPALIARCLDAADVIAAVTFAREQDLLVSVRGGGHHGAGFSVNDGGLVIDLSLMRGVRVDPARRTALVLGGSTLGDLDHATAVFGLAMPSGIFSTTGVGGLTLGGGLGYLTRKHGLSIDNLLAADVVLADGRLVTASEEEHPDLFWALRGGGGNFGIVTAFTFRLHPIATVYAGPMFWDIERSAGIMRWYRDFIADAPDDIYAFFGFHKVPSTAPFPEALWGRPVCVLIWNYTGPIDQAEAVFAPIRAELGSPLIDWVAPLPFVALQSLFDALLPAGFQWYWKADFVDDLSDEAIARHIEFGANLPTEFSDMHLYPIDGAAGRVPKDATAWNYRGVRWSSVVAAVSADPADNERMIAWARDYWAALHPHSAGGAYVNMFMEEGQDRVRAAYGDNYERLAAIKAKYDPTNLFRMNQNIQPAV